MPVMPRRDSELPPDRAELWMQTIALELRRLESRIETLKLVIAVAALILVGGFIYLGFEMSDLDQRIDGLDDRVNTLSHPPETPRQ
jgi:hypothetical protein